MPPQPFTIDEYVRWSDVDYAGIICYGAYVRFFEMAEMEMFRAAGEPYRDVFDRHDMWLPRARLACDFKYPARLDDQLRVASYVKAFGNSSLILQFDVIHLDAGRLAAVGEEVLVCTDREALKPKRFPDQLRNTLAPYQLTVEEARQSLGVRG